MAHARRRRAWALACVVPLLVATLLIAQPGVGSYSSYEDPRPGGRLILLGHAPEPAAPPDGTAEPPPDGAMPDGTIVQPPGTAGQPSAGPADGDPGSTGAGGPVWYVVRSGDTLSDISSRFGVNVSDVWIANRLINPHSIRPGQSLLIPNNQEDVYEGGAAGPAGDDPPAPVYHRVGQGENLWTIARSYGVAPGDLAEANQVPASGLIQPGDQLLIPGANTGGATTARAVDLVWPVRGTISSPFGRRGGEMHQGLDIAAPRGTSIRAAAAGRVSRVGWAGNYGRIVVVDHGNGLSTLYAHCHKVLVSRGQQVTAGQRIALVGNTGRSTGPHLHFEVIVGSQRRDPLLYLLAD